MFSINKFLDNCAGKIIFYATSSFCSSSLSSSKQCDSPENSKRPYSLVPVSYFFYGGFFWIKNFKNYSFSILLRNYRSISCLLSSYVDNSRYSVFAMANCFVFFLIFNENKLSHGLADCGRWDTAHNSGSRHKRTLNVI